MCQSDRVVSVIRSDLRQITENKSKHAIVFGSLFYSQMLSYASPSLVLDGFVCDLKHDEICDVGLLFSESRPADGETEIADRLLLTCSKSLGRRSLSIRTNAHVATLGNWKLQNMSCPWDAWVPSCRLVCSTSSWDARLVACRHMSGRLLVPSAIETAASEVNGPSFLGNSIFSQDNFYQIPSMAHDLFGKEASDVVDRFLRYLPFEMAMKWSMLNVTIGACDPRTGMATFANPAPSDKVVRAVVRDELRAAIRKISKQHEQPH